MRLVNLGFRKGLRFSHKIFTKIVVFETLNKVIESSYFKSSGYCPFYFN